MMSIGQRTPSRGRLPLLHVWGRLGGGCHQRLISRRCAINKTWRSLRSHCDFVGYPPSMLTAPLTLLAVLSFHLYADHPSHPCSKFELAVGPPCSSLSTTNPPPHTTSTAHRRRRQQLNSPVVVPSPSSPPPDASPAESPEKTVTGDSPFRPVRTPYSASAQPSRTPNLHHRHESPVSVVIGFMNNPGSGPNTKAGRPTNLTYPPEGIYTRFA